MAKSSGGGGRGGSQASFIKQYAQARALGDVQGMKKARESLRKLAFQNETKTMIALNKEKNNG
jgi:hypothetical protein